MRIFRMTTSTSSSSDSVPISNEVERILHDFQLQNIPSHLLRRAHFKAEEVFAKEFGEVGVTPRQKAALVLLYKEPGLNQNTLSDRLAMDRNTVADMVRRMSRSGLIERKPSAVDGRAYELYLAAGGIQVLNQVMPRDLEIEAQLLNRLPEEHRDLFMKYLRLIAGTEDL